MILEWKENDRAFKIDRYDTADTYLWVAKIEDTKRDRTATPKDPSEGPTTATRSRLCHQRRRRQKSLAQKRKRIRPHAQPHAHMTAHA
jgi:hypothetical protein